MRRGRGCWSAEEGEPQRTAMTNEERPMHPKDRIDGKLPICAESKMDAEKAELKAGQSLEGKVEARAASHGPAARGRGAISFLQF